MIRWLGGTLIALLAVGLAGPASAARTEFGVYGARGDAGATDECPAGQYFTGIVGNTGAWIDQITVVCSELRQDGSLGGGKTLPSRGGSGGGFKSVLCGKDEVITSMVITRNDSYQIMEVVYRCSNLRNGGGGGRHFGGNGSFVPGGPTHSCGSGQAATGMVIRYGRHVNGIALICNDYRSTAKPPPPKQVDNSSVCGPYSDRMAKWAQELRTSKCDTSTLSPSLISTDRQSHLRTCTGYGANAAKTIVFNQRPVEAVLAKCLAGGGGKDDEPKGVKGLTKATTDTDLYDKPPPTNGGPDNKKVIGILRSGQQAQLISCRSDKWCRLATGWVWGEHIKPGAN